MLHLAFPHMSPGTPEAGPGAVLGPSGVSTVSPTATSHSNKTPGPAKKSSAGAIAGGVAGGVAAITAAGLAIFFWRKRKRPQGLTQSTMDIARLSAPDNGTHIPLLQSMPEIPTASPMRFYVRASMSPLGHVKILIPSRLFLMHRTRTTLPRSPVPKEH
jgi:hypothetical protein